MDNDEFLDIETVSELKEVSCGALSVVVDFIELLDRMDSEEEVFAMLGKLKDLLA